MGWVRAIGGGGGGVLRLWVLVIRVGFGKYIRDKEIWVFYIMMTGWGGVFSFSSLLSRIDTLSTCIFATYLV